MKLLRVKNYEDMSKKGAEIILNLIKEKQDTRLGLATGSTPKGLYENLIADHKEHGTSYKSIRTYNLDEYAGLDGSHPQSYRYFMNDVLFHHIDIPLQQTHVPNGKADLLEEECKRYEAVIRESGGIDLQLLGIGTNGHIGFNEPGTPFDSRTHIIELAESTREANSRFFDSIDEVPTHAITMGIETILESKKIILLASGEAKADAMVKLLTGEVTTDFPASALRNHADVVVIADEAALKDVDLDQLKGIQLR
ncbi:glucosamine-6-phosphate deaminase [Bacillus kwashiorkori]|uniref:glucosamine-6-phosphate deaminase n=1 Tax=Bacillus kwashiorkori TaxID=1522318 RepID=UPI000785D44B|nr:glucosamine-6-phosphate deaminase [Bacillus kwashiorkori]